MAVYGTVWPTLCRKQVRQTDQTSCDTMELFDICDLTCLYSFLTVLFTDVQFLPRVSYLQNCLPAWWVNAEQSQWEKNYFYNTTLQMQMFPVAHLNWWNLSYDNKLFGTWFQVLRKAGSPEMHGWLKVRQKN